MHNLRRHLSYANVMATIALFTALGGSSYAAVRLAKGSVTARAIAIDAVSTSKVKDRSLLARDFRIGQLPAGPAGAPGAAGGAGASGSKGDTGLKGDTGAKGEPGQTGPQGPERPTLGRQGSSQENLSLTASPRVVADIGGNPGYFGNYASPLVHPEQGPSTLGIVVQAHVQFSGAPTGTTTCRLLTSRNGGTYTQAAVTVAPTTSGVFDAFLSRSFSSFIQGDSYRFQVTCENSGGTATTDEADVSALGIPQA